MRSQGKHRLCQIQGNEQLQRQPRERRGGTAAGVGAGGAGAGLSLEPVAWSLPGMWGLWGLGPGTGDLVRAGVGELSQTAALGRVGTRGPLQAAGAPEEACSPGFPRT